MRLKIFVIPVLRNPVIRGRVLSPGAFIVAERSGSRVGVPSKREKQPQRCCPIRVVDPKPVTGHTL